MKVATHVAKVDTSKCIGCRSCEAHCVSNAIRVLSAGGFNMSPCREACPAHINIPGYISLAKEGKSADAYRLIRSDNPFPSVCGRICTHPCQLKCNRQYHDDPIGIMDIKRYVSDEAFKEGVKIETAYPLNGKKVAVIGAGPSGLSCAYYLALTGYKVTVYDAAPKAGGILYFGIPEYRLPKAILARDIEVIEKSGVEIVLNTEVGKDISFDELKKNNDAVYIATGAQFSKKMNVPGEDLPGVYHGLDFLKDVAFGKEVKLGKKVIVIGGGNTAMDASRTAKRMGCDVTIVYRRRFADMPADLKEKEEAREEGIKIVELVAPLEILGTDKVTGMKFAKNKLVSLDDDDKAKVEQIPDSEFVIEADTIIPAVSQYSDLPFIDKSEVEINKYGNFVVDEGQATTMKGVFSGGDVTRGPNMAIQAIADGKNAAVHIHAYLGGKDFINKGEAVDVPDRVDHVEWQTARKQKMAETDPLTRITNFEEVACGLTADQVKTECSRCLACNGRAVVDADMCADCGLCERFCPTGAVKLVERDEPKTLYQPLLEDRMDEITEICTKAHMYPGQVVCFCYRTTAGQIASAILKGATTPEAVVRMTGARSGCAVLCITGVLRLLHAAAVDIGKAPGFQWYDQMAYLWDVAKNEKVVEKWGKEYHLLDDVEAANRLYPGGDNNGK